MSGLPGSGKTTYAKQLADEIPAIRFSPDEWLVALGLELADERIRNRLERHLWAVTQDLLGQGQNVILEFGFWKKSEREKKLRTARAIGAEVQLWYFEVSIKELLRRIEMRYRKDNKHNILITKKQLEKWAKLVEIPNDTEMKQFDRVRIVKDA